MSVYDPWYETAGVIVLLVCIAIALKFRKWLYFWIGLGIAVGLETIADGPAELVQVTAVYAVMVWIGYLIRGRIAKKEEAVRYDDLNVLEKKGIRILKNVALPGTPGKIDVLLFTTSGLFLVTERKNYSPEQLSYLLNNLQIENYQTAQFLINDSSLKKTEGEYEEIERDDLLSCLEEDIERKGDVFTEAELAEMFRQIAPHAKG